MWHRWKLHPGPACTWLLASASFSESFCAWLTIDSDRLNILLSSWSAHCVLVYPPRYYEHCLADLRTIKMVASTPTVPTEWLINYVLE
jgi:hypothetical protein